MKQGLPLSQLAANVLADAANKRDFVAKDSAWSFSHDEEHGLQARLPIGGNEHVFQPNVRFHQQASQELKINKNYYDRMLKDAPDLLAQNVNHWLHESDAKHMIRTVGTKARALLSTRYRPLDNADLLNYILPAAQERGLDTVSANVDDDHLYIKAISPKVTGEVTKGDVVQAGIIISNSEVGNGALSVQPLIYRLVCLNGAIVQDHTMRRHHTGARLVNHEDASWELYSNATRRVSDVALFMQARDLVDKFLTPSFFGNILETMKRASAQEITRDITDVVEVLSKQLDLTEHEGKGVLRWLAEGKSLTQWGLCNAITRTAQDVESYDRATQLEHFGGQILELPKQQWQALAVKV